MMLLYKIIVIGDGEESVDSIEYIENNCGIKKEL
jgi:hypothetical protein